MESWSLIITWWRYGYRVCIRSLTCFFLIAPFRSVPPTTSSNWESFTGYVKDSSWILGYNDRSHFPQEEESPGCQIYFHIPEEVVRSHKAWYGTEAEKRRERIRAPCSPNRIGWDSEWRTVDAPHVYLQRECGRSRLFCHPHKRSSLWIRSWLPCQYARPVRSELPSRL